MRVIKDAEPKLLQPLWVGVMLQEIHVVVSVQVSHHPCVDGSQAALQALDPCLSVYNHNDDHDDSNNNNNNNNNNNCTERHNSGFFTISSLRLELSPIHTLKWPGQITSNTSSAYHVQHVVLCAMWYEGTAQLLSLTEFKSHLF